MRPDIEKYLREQGWVFAGVSQPDHKRQWAQMDGDKVKRVALESELEDLALEIVEEQPDDLDEAAKEYVRNYIPFDQCDSRDILRVFKAGAEWDRAKMTENVVEVVVVDDWQYGKDTDGVKPAIKVRNPDWKIGDKKKVIILK